MKCVNWNTRAFLKILWIEVYWLALLLVPQKLHTDTQTLTCTHFPLHSLSSTHTCPHPPHTQNHTSAHTHTLPLIHTHTHSITCTISNPRTHTLSSRKHSLTFAQSLHTYTSDKYSYMYTYKKLRMLSTTSLGHTQHLSGGRLCCDHN